MTAELIFALVVGYLIGSVPFGILWARVYGLGDLRKIGSGNIGATNVLRTGNKTAAALTLACDMAKGFLAVLIAYYFMGEYAALIAGLGAFLGHIYCIWLSFDGGKGVATFIGVTLGVAPLAGIAVAVTWLVAARIGRISSLAALVSAALSPLYMWLIQPGEAVKLSIALAALIYMRHAPNITRLLKGEEPRIGQN